MFIWNWFMGVLNFLGLRNKKATILFLGLDNAGKTTLLRLLKDGHLSTHNPTQNPSHEELIMEGIKFNAHDLGGHEAARVLWTQYSAVADAVVFIVDAADTKRFEEAKDELNKLLCIEELKNAPFLILGNKIDIPGAVGLEELKKELGVTQTTGKGVVSLPQGIRPIEVFMCSIVKRTGYGEGFRWLAQYIP